MSSRQLNFSKKVQKLFGQTNAEYELIDEGDKVLVALSGGKDSLMMLHLIARLKRIAPFDFEFKAVTLSYGMGEQLEYLTTHCQEHGIEHEVIDSNIFEIAQTHIRENSSFCSFFSRMRRGALYNYALERGYNKLSLGHHMDDAAESFFMNLFNNGSLRTLAPRYTANNGLVVIRPLIRMREAMMANFITENGLKAIGDEACPAMNFKVKMPHAREETKQFLKNLEKEKVGLFAQLESAFKHVHDDTFFDKTRLK
jgi:tRNA 2-thiocytidine biosynthesis protein TtcA